ncbi:ABATE domain-containing protein [Streptomyces lasalocidi]
MDHEAPVYLHQLPVPGEDRYVSLALVNTRFTVSHGRVDLLDDAEAAHLWLVRHALLPDRVELNGRQSGRLRTLREALRTLFQARVAAAPPAPDALDALNAALAAAPATPRLAWTADGPHRAAVPDSRQPGRRRPLTPRRGRHRPAHRRRRGPAHRVRRPGLRPLVPALPRRPPLVHHQVRQPRPRGPRLRGPEGRGSMTRPHRPGPARAAKVIA